MVVGAEQDAVLLVEGGQELVYVRALGREPNCADLITSIQSVDFAEAWNGRVEGRYGDETVHFLGRAELIRNKESAGRPQDLADVAALRAANDTDNGTEG